MFILSFLAWSPHVPILLTKFRSRFNQYKSNINLHGKGQRGFMQEPLIQHFFSNKHNGSHKDTKVQIINYCDPNNPERRKHFWIYYLDNIFQRGLNTRILVLILITVWWFMLYISFSAMFSKLRDGCFSYFTIITFRNCSLWN